MIKGKLEKSLLITTAAALFFHATFSALLIFPMKKLKAHLLPHAIVYLHGQPGG
jgi:hypothetical protein